MYVRVHQVPRMDQSNTGMSPNLKDHSIVPRDVNTDRKAPPSRNFIPAAVKIEPVLSDTRRGPQIAGTQPNAVWRHGGLLHLP